MEAVSEECRSVFVDSKEVYGCELEKGHAGKHRWSIEWSEDEAVSHDAIERLIKPRPDGEKR